LILPRLRSSHTLSLVECIGEPLACLIVDLLQIYHARLDRS